MDIGRDIRFHIWSKKKCACALAEWKVNIQKLESILFSALFLPSRLKKRCTIVLVEISPPHQENNKKVAIEEKETGPKDCSVVQSKYVNMCVESFSTPEPRLWTLSMILLRSHGLMLVMILQIGYQCWLKTYKVIVMLMSKGSGPIYYSQHANFKIRHTN